MYVSRHLSTSFRSLLLQQALAHIGKALQMEKEEIEVCHLFASSLASPFAPLQLSMNQPRQARDPATPTTSATPLSFLLETLHEA